MGVSSWGESPMYIKIYPLSRQKDYGDAIVAVLCKNVKGSLIATFDLKFNTKVKKLGFNVCSF